MSQVVVPGGSKTLLFNSEGVYPLAFFATDNAGNVEATQSLRCGSTRRRRLSRAPRRPRPMELDGTTAM